MSDDSSIYTDNGFAVCEIKNSVFVGEGKSVGGIYDFSGDIDNYLPCYMSEREDGAYNIVRYDDGQVYGIIYPQEDGSYIMYATDRPLSEDQQNIESIINLYNQRRAELLIQENNNLAEQIEDLETENENLAEQIDDLETENENLNNINEWNDSENENIKNKNAEIRQSLSDSTEENKKLSAVLPIVITISLILLILTVTYICMLRDKLKQKNKVAPLNINNSYDEYNESTTIVRNDYNQNGNPQIGNIDEISVQIQDDRSRSQISNMNNNIDEISVQIQGNQQNAIEERQGSRVNNRNRQRPVFRFE